MRRTPVGMSSVKDVSLRRIALTPVVDVFGFVVGAIVGVVVGGMWWLQVDPFLRRVDTLSIAKTRRNGSTGANFNAINETLLLVPE